MNSIIQGLIAASTKLEQNIFAQMLLSANNVVILNILSV